MAVSRRPGRHPGCSPPHALPTPVACWRQSLACHEAPRAPDALRAPSRSSTSWASLSLSSPSPSSRSPSSLLTIDICEVVGSRAHSNKFAELGGTHRPDRGVLCKVVGSRAHSTHFAELGGPGLGAAGGGSGPRAGTAGRGSGPRGRLLELLAPGGLGGHWLAWPVGAAAEHGPSAPGARARTRRTRRALSATLRRRRRVRPR